MLINEKEKKNLLKKKKKKVLNSQNTIMTTARVTPQKSRLFQKLVRVLTLFFLNKRQFFHSTLDAR